MPVLLRGDRAVLFIHIPKTGGSSLEGKLAALGWRELFSIRGISAENLKFMKASPQHFHAALLEQIFNFEALSSVVAITRDPFDRFKSEYYWAFRHAKTWPNPELWIKDILARAADDPYLYDNHIRPQVDFLPRDIEVSLFKLEDDGIRQAEIAICGSYEAPTKSLWGLLSKPAPERDKASKYRPDIEAAFAAQRGIITDFYADDYARFGYDPAGVLAGP